jgi:hypothetical protein
MRVEIENLKIYEENSISSIGEHSVERRDAC